MVTKDRIGKEGRSNAGGDVSRNRKVQPEADLGRDESYRKSRN